MPNTSATSKNNRPPIETDINRLLVADPSLCGFSGHYYEYARAVGTAAARINIESILVGHRSFKGESSLDIFPLFRLQTYDLVNSRLPTPLRMIITARAQAKDLKRMRRHFSLGSDDLILMPTVSIPVLFGLLYAFGFSVRRRNMSTIAVVLRDTMKIHRSAVKTLTSLFFKLAKAMRAASWLQIYVDTVELQDEYASITNFPITVLPIPIERETIEGFDETGRDNRLTLSMLGDARLGKGIDMIPDLVEELLVEYPNQLKFIIQTSTPVVGANSKFLDATLARLNQIDQEQDALVLLSEPLTTQEYFSTIAQSDIMLHPYRAESYRYQSSGMFAEALALGKAVVVPADTWMSRELEKRAGGGISFKIGDADSLKQSVRIVIDNIESYKRQSQNGQAGWLAEHNSDEVIAEIIRTIRG